MSEFSDLYRSLSEKDRRRVEIEIAIRLSPEKADAFRDDPVVVSVQQADKEAKQIWRRVVAQQGRKAR
jgi:hypothetical protein